MRASIRFHPEHTRLVWIILGLLGIISLLCLAMFLFGPPYIPLWYSLTLMEEQLAERTWIISVAGLALVISVISLWFGRHTSLEHERYVAGLSLWSGASLLVLLLVALFRIIKVVL